uniref:Biogenesis of lysosome-related organelles complex 1 subunit 1 n=1 Tax=Ditylenchus dipsaci TaxID=166011 RepID=A0A915DIL5_9BILA
MVLSSEKVSELVDTTIAESRKTIEILQDRCNSWENYRKELAQSSKSVSQLPEIKQQHEPTFDANSFVQNIHSKLQDKIARKGDSKASEYNAQKKDVSSLNNYITDMHNWIAEYGNQLDRAIESLDNELVFVQDFCRSNSISLD